MSNMTVSMFYVDAGITCFEVEVFCVWTTTATVGLKGFLMWDVFIQITDFIKMVPNSY